MDYNPEHGEPSPFEAVSRNGHPGIIRPVTGDEPHPFRDSPTAMALLDALLPGAYLHDAIADFSKQGDFEVCDTKVEMKLGEAEGGKLTVVVTTNKLPSPFDLPEWTQHGPRSWEYRGIEIEIELLDDFDEEDDEEEEEDKDEEEDNERASALTHAGAPASPPLRALHDGGGF